MLTKSNRIGERGNAKGLERVLDQQNHSLARGKKVVTASSQKTVGEIRFTIKLINKGGYFITISSQFQAHILDSCN